MYVETRGVTTLLGNDGKMMSEHKLIGSPLYAVSDS